MKKTMILIMAVATTIKATAQSVTYNHDSSKQNQITVMETGGVHKVSFEVEGSMYPCLILIFAVVCISGEQASV